MKTDDEKERNNRIESLIHFLRQSGTKKAKQSLEKFLAGDNCHKKNQSEEDYRKEQKEWLEKIEKKGKS